MLIALIFRGVAFEFRFRANTKRWLWDWSFTLGSTLATFAQGIVLGAFIRGFEIEGRHFAGGLFDWLNPFTLLTGAGLLAGYALLASTWLIIKTEGRLQAWARRVDHPDPGARARLHRRRQRLDAADARGDRRALVLLAQHRVPVAGAAGDCGAGLRAVHRRAAQPRGHPVPRRRRPVPVVLRRARHQLVAERRAAGHHHLGGIVVARDPAIPALRRCRGRAADPVYTAYSYYVFRGKVRADAGYH